VLCDKSEILLIVEKWCEELVSVLFIMTVFDQPQSPFVGMRLRGVIAGIDHNLPGFSFRRRRDDSSIEEVVVHLENWNIGYGDQSAFTKEPNQINPEIRESFTLDKPGVSIAICALADS
jgi:hypothetical protein